MHGRNAVSTCQEPVYAVPNSRQKHLNDGRVGRASLLFCNARFRALCIRKANFLDHSTN